MTVSDTTHVQERVEAIRQQTVRIFADLEQKTQQFDLPTLPADVAEYQKKLATTGYNVLVIGEAKRGKSSFVNALIGRDLLPTDVDIATNQVFRISNAQREAYRLRFVDNTVQTISAQELLEYGSQTVADRKGTSQVDLDRVQQIEVEVPALFLPEGVACMDTPGLGTLYAAHALITQRFVPSADAVIFVLDSGQPIGQFELDFLESILKVTQHIFFIQTKIDLYDKEQWEQVRQRSQQILQDRFHERLPDIRVWPISSRNLMKAGQMNSLALLRVSRQQDLMQALTTFLFKVAGWNRCASALTVADHYYSTARQALEGRLAILEKSSTQELYNRQQTMTDRGQQLQSEWGTPGKKRRELLNDAKKIIAVNKQSLIDLLESGGTLEKEQREKIDAVTSLDAVNELGGRMSREIVEEATVAWRMACERARTDCSQLLVSVGAATDELVFSSDDLKLSMHLGSGINEKNNLSAKLWGAQNDFMQGAQFGLAAAPFAIILLHVALPAVLVGVVAAGVLAAVRAWKDEDKSQVQQGKQKLNDYLDEAMQAVNKRVLQPDVRYSGKTLLDHYFDSLLEVVEERIDEIVKMKAEDAQRESTRFEEQARMSKQEREKQAATFRQQLGEWDVLGGSIDSAITALQALEQSVTKEV
jgi:GTPase SAR1 family protein